MLTTKLHECGLSVFYDGNEFSVIPYADDLIGVYCKRRNEWTEYIPGHAFRTFQEVCESIFYDSILVERTECGHFLIDDFGNITGIVPLSYYESPAA